MISFYVSPDEEARALARACARVGCELRAVGIRPTSAGPRAVGSVTCTDGWMAARLLLALAIEDSRTPGARNLALTLRREASTDEEFARVVHAFVKDNVDFVREAGEVFQGAAYTLEMGAGDCDDHFRLVYALAVAGGLKGQLGILHKPNMPPSHAVALLCPDSTCAWAETTVDAAYGEHPVDAAIRLGLVNARADLARGVTVMTEKDLPPPPPNFVAKNPIGYVDDDASALEALGYLRAGVQVSSAVDPVFRQGVASFQRATPGLVVDGLIGPHTRMAIAGALGAGGETYLGDVGMAYTQTSDLPDAFFAGLKAYAVELKFDPVWMLDIMWEESGIKPSAAYRHPPDFATGLIGFEDVHGVGAEPDNSLASHDAFAKLSAVQQLPYARNFWRPMAGKATSGANLFQYNFLPASLARGTSDDTVVCAKNGTGYNGQEAHFYAVNTVLDTDKDGYITVADLGRRLDASKRTKTGALIPRYAEALARLGGATPAVPSGAAPASVGGIVGVGLLVAGAAALGWAWWTA